MTKILPGFPEPDENDALFPALAPSQRAGMFGAGRRTKNSLISALPAASPTPYPFNLPSSAIGPDAIAGLLANPSAGSGLPLPAWARAGGEDGLFTGPDIQFSVPEAGAPTSAATPHYRVPPPDVIAAAQADQRSRGIPASATIAQWMHEGGWGRHIPPDSNNYWGIKEPDPRKPNVKVKTTEYRAGKRYTIQQQFRKFASPEEGWAAHTRLLTTDPRYAKAMALTHDPNAFVDALAQVYAHENPYYAQRIKDTMRKNHLYQYNDLPDDSK
jgi:hypothetical protein